MTLKAQGGTPSDDEAPLSLLGEVRANLGRYAFGAFLLLLYQAGQYGFDRILESATNLLVNEGREEAIRLGLILAGLAALLFFVRVGSRVAIFNAGRFAEYRIRERLVAHLHRMDSNFFVGKGVGDLMSRVTNDLSQVRTLLGFGALNFLNTILALVSSLAVTFRISTSLTLAALCTVPPLMIFVRFFARHIYERQKNNQIALGELSERVQQSISAVRMVRAFAIEEDELRRFDRVNEDYLEKNLSLAKLRGAMWPIMQLLTASGVVVVFWYGSSLLRSAEIDAGQFMAFYRALARFTSPLIRLGFLVSVIQRGRASFLRVQEIAEVKATIRSGDSPLPKGSHLKVEHLYLERGGQEVLRDISLELPTGGSLALVGRTGSGKTSLALALTRLIDAPKGAIFIDGVDICDLPLSGLRTKVAYAQQQAFLFSNSLEENLSFAAPTSSRSVIEKAAADAHLTQEIDVLPDGYRTMVGERGVQLSGGQKQRVSLARALLAEPEILIVDDPLSAVDAKTERSILERLEERLKGRSFLLITHRVSAAKLCDRIAVLDEGKLLDIGTHDELSERCERYRSFVSDQEESAEEALEQES